MTSTRLCMSAAAASYRPASTVPRRVRAEGRGAPAEVEGGGAVHAGPLVAQVDRALGGPEQEDVHAHERHEGHEHRDPSDAVAPVAVCQIVVCPGPEDRRFGPLSALCAHTKTP